MPSVIVAGIACGLRKGRGYGIIVQDAYRIVNMEMQVWSLEI